MKTKIHLPPALLGLFFLCVLLSSKLSAQSISTSYFVGNSANCTVEISYTLYDPACTSIGSFNASIPVGGTTLTLPTTDSIEITALWINTSSCNLLQSNPAFAGSACLGMPNSASIPIDPSAVGCSNCAVSLLTVGTTSASIN